MTVPGGVTRFPNNLSVGSEDSIFANLPSPLDIFVLYQDFFDFTLELDFPGGQSEWSTYGSVVPSYPGLPFGVIRLTPNADDTGGIVQDVCQAIDFTIGNDLWARFRFSTPQENTQVWCGMASADPNNGGVGPPDYQDAWDQACMFHVLSNDEITLEVWVGTLGTVPVQTITVPGSMPRDGSYIELAYHYDGEFIEIAINRETVGRALMPVVPTLTLHGSMGARDASTMGNDVADFDYYYSAQLREGN